MGGESDPRPWGVIFHQAPEPSESGERCQISLGSADGRCITDHAKKNITQIYPQRKLTNAGSRWDPPHCPSFPLVLPSHTVGRQSAARTPTERVAARVCTKHHVGVDKRTHFGRGVVFEAHRFVGTAPF